MQPTASTPTVSDAPQDNWVDRRAPARWRPFLRLSRADRPIGTWLLLLPCWWGTGLAMIVDRPRWADLWVALACAIGAAAMRGAGCTWNDLTDRDYDAMVARTRSRPLPSGQVTVRGAWLWMAVQTALGGLMLLTMNGAAIALGVASLGLVVIYPFAKRFTWWPQVFLGLAFNWGALVAFAAHGGTLHPAAMLAYAAGIAWTLFYDTIYAHQDTEDDILIGVRSTARLFGEDSPRWLLGFAAAAVVLLSTAVAAARPAPLAALVAMLGIAAFAGHLWWQLGRLQTGDPAVCLRLFRSNRDAGLMVALALVLAGLA
ncbi:4-hydroxybenzoate octaprenyltransferase [Paracoccus contaminans]|uniref:4-hydroxybenzoate octaprenyltransferase n=1 Tax=Paracoccus contaminans TaxID=1945662 RepID=A0A1W6CWU2_9RHOB|nr:4-hydroxybenzoate octaprenyltransferase [Paracoccus contaminans]ARJ69342.1 4-hydroxybenzoate polyprenyltransferase [Paracoccus contaminans]